MKKGGLLMVLTVVSFMALQAQHSFPITSHYPTGRLYQSLLLPNAELERNDTLNEEILDLVEPTVWDSVIHKKKQHHMLFLLGWSISTFANINWRPVQMNKTKFTGTIRGNGRSGNEHYTEYDLNYDLYFHTRKYLERNFTSFDRQRQIHRQDLLKRRKIDYSKAPFVRDTANINMYQYRLHCELTPPRAYRPQLHYSFFPVLPGINHAGHPSFANEYPSMGFYGTWCLDCNHSCHGELHPYEWVWWLNLKDTATTRKTWMVGLFHEGSKRFPDWSRNPKSGTFSIPFAFRYQSDSAHSITIEHLVYNSFIDSNVAKMSVPANAVGPAQSIPLLLTDAGGGSYRLRLNFAHPIVTGGLRYWLSNLNWDETSRILSGDLHFAVSVVDLYTAKVVME